MAETKKATDEAAKKRKEFADAQFNYLRTASILVGGVLEEKLSPDKGNFDNAIAYAPEATVGRAAKLAYQKHGSFDSKFLQETVLDIIPSMSSLNVGQITQILGIEGKEMPSYLPKDKYLDELDQSTAQQYLITAVQIYQQNAQSLYRMQVEPVKIEKGKKDTLTLIDKLFKPKEETKKE